MRRLETTILQHTRRCPLSYRQIESRTGVAASTLCRAVGGHRRLSADAIDRLTIFFGLELVASRRP